MRDRHIVSAGVIATTAVIAVIVLFIGCYYLFNKPESDAEPSVSLTGIYEGSYTWTSASGGSASVVIELTQHGPLLSGTASYLGSTSALAGSLIGSSVELVICGNAVISYNVFSGKAIGNRISGTTLNGEDSSAPVGPSGSFELWPKAGSQGNPCRLALYGPKAIVSGDTSTARVFAVEVQDLAELPAPVAADTRIVLADDGTGSFFADKEYSLPIVSLVIPAGGMSAVFYYMDSVAGTRVISASDESGNLSRVGETVVVIVPGGEISCSIDGTPVRFMRDVSVMGSEGSDGLLLSLLGYDDARNSVNAFFREEPSGSYSCVSVYYQTREGAQWGSGGSIGGTCNGSVSLYGAPGDPVAGSFSADLVAQFGGAVGEKKIEGGTFSAIRWP